MTVDCLCPQCMREQNARLHAITIIEKEELRTLRLEAASWRSYQESLKRQSERDEAEFAKIEEAIRLYEESNRTLPVCRMPLSPLEVIYVGLHV